MIDFGKTNFVKVYLYDDTDWNRVGNEGRCLQLLLWRKLDREGGADVDADPEERIRDIADLVRAPEEFVRVGLEALLRRKMLVLQAGPEGKARLVDPTFKAAQETRQSSTQRSRNHRERKAEERSEVQRDATSGDALQPAATDATPRIEEKRVEETRSEEISPLPPPGGQAEKVVSSAPAGKQAAPAPSTTAPFGALAQNAGTAAEPTLTAPAALAILAKAAGPRLVLHPPGRPYASETGLAPDDETSWCYAWHKLREAWGEADLKALGEEIAAGRLWAHLKRGVSAAYLVKNLTDGLQQAAAPAPALPPPPDPRPPPRPHTRTAPERIGVTLAARADDPQRAAEELQRGKALLARLGVRLPPEAEAAMGGTGG